MSATGGAWHARDLQPEVMDRADLPEGSHHAALAGLARLNAWSATTRPLLPPLRELAHRAPGPLTLLDVACGGGDVPLRLWRRAQREHWPLLVSGCDRSALALSHARERARAAGAPLTFFARDAFVDEPLPEVDVVTCSLFMHHLDEAQAVQLLQRMAASARHLLLVSDLRRSVAGLALAWSAARLLTRSPIVHADAPASVRAAFTTDEARELARRAGLADAAVRHVFPQRWLLQWSRR